MYIIENPTIPSALEIVEPLKAGTEIELHGTAHNEFAIELLSGANVVLHMNFRNHELVLNSFLNDHWGSEIRHNHPLTSHDQFHVRIFVHEGYYNITVNNDLLVEYEHRFPVMAVQAIGIKGAVNVQSIIFKGFEFKTEWKKRHQLINGAVTNAYDSVPHAPSLSLIEGTQYY
ncbi:unnamed protein product [Caenorhabditis nigoni]